MSAHSALTSGSASSAAALEQLAAARAAYLKRVEDAVGALKSQGLQDTAKVGAGAACPRPRQAAGLRATSRRWERQPGAPPTSLVSASTLHPQAAADAVLEKVAEARAALPALPNRHAVLGEVEAVWGRFTALPAVERLLSASRGGVEVAWSTYTAAHSAVVADPRYASAVGKGSELLAGLQATAAYRAASARLAPLADTALAKAAEPYAKAVASHLAPAVAAS